MSQTPNHGYNVPQKGAKNWHKPLNDNFRQYDIDIEVRDAASNRGNYTPKQGAKFLATDLGVVYLGDGSNWLPMLALSRLRTPATTGAAANLIAGHPGNSVASGISGATVAGGGFDDGNTVEPNEVTAPFGTVGGGRGNAAGAENATVAGGEANSASGQDASVGGGTSNVASGQHATVGGGDLNRATGQDAIVAGGMRNEATNQWSTVGGGNNNVASAGNSTIAGGSKNTAEFDAATVAGGYDNTAKYTATVGGGAENSAGGDHSTVGGGEKNTASAEYTTVGGGGRNEATDKMATVAGGVGNTADSTGTVGGGLGNSAGYVATVPGGRNNAANGSFSFAAGRQATADGDGSFAWGDSTQRSVTASRADQFLVQAGGGVTVFSSSDASTGAELPPGGGSWSSLSASSAKTNMQPVDPGAVLDRVADLDVSRWEYDSQEDATHMGPMAEDFHDAFGLGADRDRIATVDADGVALAAIKGLDQRVDDCEARVADLEREVERRDERIADLEATVAEQSSALSDLRDEVADLRETVGETDAA
jgi:hypothetical protein